MSTIKEFINNNTIQLDVEELSMFGTLTLRALTTREMLEMNMLANVYLDVYDETQKPIDITKNIELLRKDDEMKRYILTHAIISPKELKIVNKPQTECQDDEISYELLPPNAIDVITKSVLEFTLGRFGNNSQAKFQNQQTATSQ